jgi:SAM-dependent methyltransferase
VGRYYLFDHRWEQERDRLDLLQRTFDPATLSCVGELPVPVGGRCLEVGGGAGSIARWMCERVGPTGRVLATDLETDFLELLTEENLEVRRHDVVIDELEDGAFDLVHARLVLSHIPERDLALKRLAAALRPGGWLVVEEFDMEALRAAPNCAGGDLLDRANRAMWGAMTAAGYDGRYGPRLPLEFRAAGLVELGARGHVGVALAGTPAAGWWHLNLVKFRSAIIAAGATEAEADEVAGMTDGDGFCMQYPILFSTWGRRPTG